MTHIRTGNNVIITAFFMSTKYISCLVPYFKNVRVNPIIQVSIYHQLKTYIYFLIYEQLNLPH
jgi:hypothetical protein